MKKALPFLTLLWLLSACGGSEKPDVVTFKSGAYGSKAGQFIIEFPGKPQVSTHPFNFGTMEGEQYTFRYKIGNEYLYAVSYVDFSPTLLASWDMEQLFDQNIKVFTSGLDAYNLQDRQVNDEKMYEKSISYTLYAPATGSMAKLKFLRYGDRIYQISFSCDRNQPPKDEIDQFFNSFNIYQPKQSN